MLLQKEKEKTFFRLRILVLSNSWPTKSQKMFYICASSLPTHPISKPYVAVANLDRPGQKWPKWPTSMHAQPTTLLANQKSKDVPTYPSSKPYVAVAKPAVCQPGLTWTKVASGQLACMPNHWPHYWPHYWPATLLANQKSKEDTVLHFFASSLSTHPISNPMWPWPTWAKVATVPSGGPLPASLCHDIFAHTHTTHFGWVGVPWVGGLWGALKRAAGSVWPSSWPLFGHFGHFGQV